MIVMKMNKIYTPFIALLLVACQADELQPAQQQTGTLSFTTSVQQFESGANTRAENDVTLGDANFVAGEKIKIKIVCPVSDRVELGEDTYSGSFDGFYLLKWHADTLATLTYNDGYDINGDYSASDSPDIYSRYLAQPTPYVFTAQSWSEEQVFIAGTTTNEKRVEQYSNVFHANQSLLANYRASDLIWAQTVMQTGCYNVHLSFKHVMAVLLITIDGAISDDAVLTVTDMPDIDQTEVIVGDYFACKSQVNASGSGYDCSYKTKSSITAEADNGKALGIAVVDDNTPTVKRVAFADINQSATYTAYRVPNTNTFRLIVPPCVIKNATIWLRTGENLKNRYSMPLNSGSSFTPEAGTRYHLTMTI